LAVIRPLKKMSARVRQLVRPAFNDYHIVRPPWCLCYLTILTSPIWVLILTWRMRERTSCSCGHCHRELIAGTNFYDSVHTDSSSKSANQKSVHKNERAVQTFIIHCKFPNKRETMRCIKKMFKTSKTTRTSRG
jgi:hypothetical protein